MVANWIKFLRKEKLDVSSKIYLVVEQILNGNLDGLDIKTIEGFTDHFRCRVGKIRIIFTKINGKVNITKIGYRGDVYK